MNPEFAYFLKVNAALALFYAFYRLFFYKDTFFKLRRFILLAFFCLAFLYPLMNMQGWMREQEELAGIVAVYASIMLPEVTITADSPTVADTSFNREVLLLLASGIYVLVVILLLLRFCLRSGSIIWLGMRSKRTVIQGVPIYALPQPAGPFSFFRYIFLHPDSHSEKETDEILTHECAHVSQWHSMDVVVSELVTTFCWFNPFVWLLKREVRHNLEYLADNRVIELGYDSRNYQYHLLGLALHHPEPSGLYNSFNVLHIKNRILMMNKKRSHGIGRAKYLFFIPLVLVLMLLNNIGALAGMTNRLAENMTHAENMADELPEQQAPPVTISVDRPATEKPRETAQTSPEVLPSPPVASRPVAPQPETSKSLDDMVFTIVENMPSFPGGENELLRFLTSNIRYPADAIRDQIQGRVVCSFILSKEGKVEDVTVSRGVSPSLDQEAVRVIRLMPAWNPGMQRERPVSVKYSLPVIFRLSERQATDGDPGKDYVYTVIPHMPEYPGGESELVRYLASNIKYPVEAQENGIQGRVTCSFTINQDGSIGDASILRGVDPLLDREALRVLTSMSNWTPGRLSTGETARVKYTLPVIFRIQS